MQLKKLILSRNIAKSIYRRFVSTVEVDVNSLSSIKVKSKDFFGSEDQKVKFTIFDENKEINLSSLSGIELTSNADAFKFKCSESKDLSILLELPVETSQELQLDVLAKKSIVQVLGIQAKSIKIKIDAGNVVLQNLKSDLIKADIDHGDIETKGLLLGKKIELEAENGDVSIEKSQGDYIKVKARSIKVESCYNTLNKFKATKEMCLKNLHGSSVIKFTGENFKLSGFSGLLYAELDSKNIDIQLSELFGENEISSVNSKTFKLGFSEAIVGDTTVKIESDCPIENSIPELMICVKNEESFEVKKKNEESKNLLKVKVVNGKILELSKMSWIDSLNLKQN